jgi:hypothetical protein
MLIENSQGFETFELFKKFIRKLFQTLNYLLKNSFEKIEFPNTTLHSFKPMQTYLHRKYL